MESIRKKTIALMCAVLCMGLSGCSSSDGPDVPYEPVPLTRAEQDIVDNGGMLGYTMLLHTYSPEYNTVESPLSLSVALGILANGAGGTTLDQLLELLGAGSLDELNSCLDKVSRNLRNADRKVDLKLSNSVWFDKGFDARPEYKKAVETNFGAELFTERLSTEATMRKINRWCSDRTEGMINDFLEEPVGAGIDMTLYNATYFHGEWKEKFDPKDTVDKFFHNAQGGSNTVRMMYKSKGIGVYRADEYSQTVEVPYGNGNFYLYLELPAEGMTVPEVIEARLAGQAPEIRDATVTKLGLPRFRAEWRLDVGFMLQSMGYDAILDKQGYPLVSDGLLSLPPVWQSAVIEIDEEGTKAAAVTGGGCTSPGIMETVELVFDRPFIYSIKERTTGATVFCGVINML